MQPSCFSYSRMLSVASQYAPLFTLRRKIVEQYSITDAILVAMPSHSIRVAFVKGIAFIDGVVLFSIRIRSCTLNLSSPFLKQNGLSEI